MTSFLRVKPVNHSFWKQEFCIITSSRSSLLPSITSFTSSIRCLPVELLYPCYLKPAPSDGAGPADITRLCQLSEGEGRKEKEEEEPVWGEGKDFQCTAGQGSSSATHCFVIVPMAFCPQWSAGKAASRDWSETFWASDVLLTHWCSDGLDEVEVWRREDAGSLSTFVREKVERKHGCLTRVEDKKKKSWNNPQTLNHMIWVSSCNLFLWLGPSPSGVESCLFCSLTLSLRCLICLHLSVEARGEVFYHPDLDVEPCQGCSWATRALLPAFIREVMKWIWGLSPKLKRMWDNISAFLLLSAPIHGTFTCENVLSENFTFLR